MALFKLECTMISVVRSAHKAIGAPTAKSQLDAHGQGHAMKTWFVPPIVIPVTIVLVVAVYAVIRALH
jgi:hypothetical protein